MLRITAMKSEKYFTEGLQKADYYRDQVLLDPVYVGSLAEKLGIAGVSVTAENFTQLFNNINPATGNQVTPVMAKDRKNYYDFTFSAPKSVSVLWATTDNIKLHEAINTAFDESVRESMSFAEKKFSLARDKRGGGNVYNNTENLLYSFFRHDTARPVGGVADPHLHTHCTVFNMTFDSVVGKFKAMEFHDFAKYRNQIEAYHHSTLAKKLQELGIRVENTYNSFEVAGFNRELIEKFSNRTKIIEEYVLINDISSETAKGEAGRKTREKKQSQELSREQSKENWISRFSSSELVFLRGIETSFTRGDSVVRENTEESSKVAVEQSISHFLERDTVVDQNAVITYAMNSNLSNVSYYDVVKVLDSKLKNKEVLISKDYQDSSNKINGLGLDLGLPNQNVRGGNRVEFLTTSAVIEMENEIIKYIKNSTGNYKPINSNYQLEKSMSVDQDKVFYQVIKSKNSIDVIKGNPGSGKTYLLKELKKAIESSDKTLYAYAPTSIAGRKVLREEVTEYANTVQYLFASKEEQAKLNNKSVVVIDEAGLLSYSDMLQLMKLQSEKEFKLIAVGDTKQNSPVNSGSGLKVIEQKTKLEPFRLNEIRRQNANPIYKRAVEHLTALEIKEGYEALDNAGYIVEVKSKKDRNKLIAQKYIGFVLQDNLLRENIAEIEAIKPSNEKTKELLGKYSTNDVLALSASVMEVKELNKNIRSEMIKNRLVGGVNIDVTILVDKKYTLAEKQNRLIYKSGDVLVATQNTSDLKLGKEYKVLLDSKDNDKPKITVYRSDKENPKKRIKKNIDIPVKDAQSFNVNSQEKLKLAKGDTVTLTLNGKSETGTRLLKEARHQVKSIEIDPKTKKPKITLENDQVLKQDFKYLNYGYATTNYKSQGQTVKNVLISQSEQAYPASGRQSLLVASSRAKETVLIATDDKKALKKSFHLDRSKKIGKDLQKPKKVKSVASPSMRIGL